MWKRQFDALPSPFQVSSSFETDGNFPFWNMSFAERKVSQCFLHINFWIGFGAIIELLLLFLIWLVNGFWKYAQEWNEKPYNPNSISRQDWGTMEERWSELGRRALIVHFIQQIAPDKLRLNPVHASHVSRKDLFSILFVFSFCSAWENFSVLNFPLPVSIEIVYFVYKVKKITQSRLSFWKPLYFWTEDSV